MDKVVVVAGVTASGKSRLAVQLALLFDGEIISADAYQVYKGMDIGTNKITKEAMQGVPHHLIDCVTVDDPWDVSIFQTEGRRLIREIVARKKVPIVCGGTGFYINALLKDYRFLPLVPRNDYAALTNEQLHMALRDADAAEADKIPVNNRRRVEKALDFVRGHGIKKSAHDQGHDTYLYDALILFLDPPKRIIAPLIEKRVERMLADGWKEEVDRLVSQHPRFPQSTAVKAIGYEAVLAGNPDSRQIAAQVLDYSRRQRTWFVNKRSERIAVFQDAYSEQLLVKCRALVDGFLSGAPCA